MPERPPASASRRTRGFTLDLMIPAGLKQRVHDLLGPRGYLERPEDLALYEYDGGVDKHPPDLVAFPRSTAEEIGRASCRERV